MRLDPQEWTHIALLSGRETEPRTASRLESLLAPGDTFVDVGAHVAWLTLLGARRVGPGGRVVAVNQQPYNCERILANTLVNGFENILVVPAALSDENRFIKIAQQCGQDKARLTLAGPGVNDTKSYFLATCLRFDTLVAEVGLQGSIKLLKIDVEGHELAVLAGASETLARVENIIYETLPATDAAVHYDIARRLIEAGFELATVDGVPWSPGDLAPESNVWARRPLKRDCSIQ